MRLPLLLQPLFSPKGAEYEDAALRFLQNQGLRLVARNYRCRGGEIDLIMQQDDYLVFVEVRFRAGRSYGGAAASVTRTKQQKIRMTASHYLQTHGFNESQQACRFDVVAYEGSEQCQWYINAFQGS